MSTDINRFVEAQDNGIYERAFTEIKEGHKESHWIWYIFPQLKGLGRSYNSEFYGINDLNEAKEYLQHPVLGMRLKKITRAFMAHENLSAHEILGGIDARKVKSCMTLFSIAADSEEDKTLFQSVLDKYYDGKTDRRTTEICQ